MAKYERCLTGDFSEVLALCDRAVMKSLSASREDGSDYERGGVRVAVRVYERYSMIGSNRVSLSLTLVGNGSELFLTAVASGGSQAVFFKINTWGEESFLDTLRYEIDAYTSSR